MSGIIELELATFLRIVLIYGRINFFFVNAIRGLQSNFFEIALIPGV